MRQAVRAQFLAGPNLLTGNTDEHWRAVRKGVAPAFSAANMRCAPCLAWAPAWTARAPMSIAQCCCTVLWEHFLWNPHDEAV